MRYKPEEKEISNEMLAQIMMEIREIRSELTKINVSMNGSIKENIVGEWKMVWSENFQQLKNSTGCCKLGFSANLKFELDPNGKLRYVDRLFAGVLTENARSKCLRELYVENDHLKTSWPKIPHSADRFIKDGQLHVINNRKGLVFKRVYEKI